MGDWNDWKCALRFACLVLLSIGSGIGQVQAEPSVVKTVVAFGTSLTARGGWQAGLEQALSSCFARPVSVKTVALSGATSDWALTRIGDVVALNPDVVVIEFYANDASLHRFVSVAESRAHIAAILKGLRAGLPEARLIVQIMNPFSGMRGLIRPWVDSYIEAHRQQAQALGAEIVDHRPSWARMSKRELDDAIPDGAHPLPAVAARIIVPELARKIARRAC